MTMLDDQQIADLYKSNPTMAMVGASGNPDRESYDILAYLLEQGFHVVPVNPRESEIQGQKAYASLAEIPEPIDVVLVYRRAEDAAEVAAEGIAAGAKVVWLPVGTTSDEAEAAAEAAGIGYIEDRCPRATHKLMRNAGML